MDYEFSPSDTSHSHRQRVPLVSLLLGAAAGATAGLLLARTRGRDARAYLQNRTRAGRDAVSRTWEKGRRRFQRPADAMGPASRGAGATGDGLATDERAATEIIDRAVAERAAARRDHLIDLER